jgi:nitrite reductase (NADH) large subunit
MGKRQRLAIIGCGMAANALVEELTRLGSWPEANIEISMFGAERHSSYNRVLISQVLTGEKTLKDIMLHEDSWYAERGIRVFTGRRVREIKRRTKAIVMEDGREHCYDKLVIATGSLPVIPRIKGIEKNGVMGFRSLDDCDRIRGCRRDGAKAVVLGGGILGLEAAYALKALGFDVTVAHIVDRLMERQLDAIASGFLRHDLEDIGIKVVLEKEATEVIGPGHVEGIRFKDGAELKADIVLVSAGIAPNKSLAEASGIYSEKGIVVSDTMQTYDPSVYAIGECIQHRGMCYGLVGPVFEQAKVLANHVAGDSRLTFRAVPSSARLKIPGIELYSAGWIDARPEADAIEYIDRRARVYKKAFISGDRVTGIIMYGESSLGPELFSMLVGGSDISAKRQRLFFPQASLEDSGHSIDALPDSAIICGCNGITKGAIREAIERKGLFTRAEVSRETRAGTSCGGCQRLIDQILESVLGGDFQAGLRPASLCACTKYTRDDIIKNIREGGLRSVTEVMEVMGWETVGCETCRPAINYYLNMCSPAGYEDDVSSRLPNERMHANIQKDGTYSVVPRMYGGATTPEDLKKIAEVSAKYGAGLVKITGGQRVAILGIKKEDLPGVWAELNMPSGFAYAKALRTVKTCVGDAFCRYGTQDSMGLGIDLEKMLEGLWMPAKLKLSVSGCPRNCSESGIKDIGVVGVSGAWEVLVGGCGGIELKAGERLATVKTKEEAVDVISAFIQLYREEADYGERTFKWLRRFGLEAVKKAVIEDPEKRSMLINRLKEALSSVKEPWAERVRRAKVAV